MRCAGENVNSQSSHCGSAVTNTTRIPGGYQFPASLCGLRIQHWRALWCRLQRQLSAPVLLWLWCRSAAVAPIQPLAWELPYAMGIALKRPKKKKKKKETHLLCDIPAKGSQPEFNHETLSDKPNLEIFCKIFLCQGHGSQGKAEDCSKLK